MLEATTRPSEANSTEVTDDDDDDFGLDIDDTFALEVEKEEKEEDFNYDDVEENPVSEVITGLANWWDNFSPFAPKPTTTQASPETQPDEDDDQDDDEEVEPDDDDAADTLPPTPRPTTTTTTTTTPVPYTLPPARKSLAVCGANIYTAADTRNFTVFSFPSRQRPGAPPPSSCWLRVAI